ncbi:MAG: hypothetical protein WC748_04775 [Legionellales bacterium]|jgi:hypothetical protein
MKRIAIVSISLSLGLFSATALCNKAIHYLQDCSHDFTDSDTVTYPGYGKGYFYIPGTEPAIVHPEPVRPVCLNILTGETKQQVEGVTITGRSDLSTRILALETQLDMLWQPAAIQTDESVPFTSVTYVVICTLFGREYINVPGTPHMPNPLSICVNPATGDTKQYSNDGTLINGQSELAQRVEALEKQFNILQPEVQTEIDTHKLAAVNTAIEYTKQCSTPTYDAGAFFLPGTDICLNDMTGTTQKYTMNGLISGQSELAQRVLALETQLNILN